MPYLILIVIVVLMSYEALSLHSTRNERVLASTTTLTTEQRLSSLERRVSNLEKYTGIVKTTASGPARESYVSLMGGTVMADNNWTKIPGTDFVFDQSLFGNVISVSWQGWINSGYGSVRIYDNTNHRVVDNSEVTVASGEKASFYSKPLSIWRGQNQYWIEAKGVAGEVDLSQPSLKLVTK